MAGSPMKRLHALVLLGWHFCLHILKKLTLLYRPGGLEQLEENFSDDRLRRLTASQRQSLANWQHCIGCGLCDRIEPTKPLDAARRAPRPSHLARAGIRDLSNLHHLESTAAVIAEHYDGSDFERVCPQDIDIVEIAEFITEDDTKPETGGHSPDSPV